MVAIIIPFDRESIQNLTKTNQLLLERLGDVDADLDILLARLETQGYSEETLERVEQSLVAESALQQEIVADAEEVGGEVSLAAKVREDRGITVQYLSQGLQDIDPGIVGAQLDELGFQTQFQASPQPELPTNAIKFGAEVALEDVKLVALTLLRAGVRIESIQPFAGDNERPSLIQVGTVDHDEEWSGSCSAWTVDLIRAATNFTAQNQGCPLSHSDVAQSSISD